MTEAGVLDAVGPRLRTVRRERGATLQDVSARSGLSVSTLSRLENGRRRPTLELLLPLARVYGVTIDDLVGAPPTGDPRIVLRPVRRGPLTFIPLSRYPGGVQAYKVIFPGRTRPARPKRQRHEGREWVYVLSGRLQLLLADQEVVLGPGEAAEFETTTPHALAAVPTPRATPVELLVLFGPQGERAHVPGR